MSSVNTTYQTFKNALAALSGEGTLPSRLTDAQTLLKSLAPAGDHRPIFDNAVLQARFERLLTDGGTDPEGSAKELLQLFEEISAVYHGWMSQAGRSC